MWQRIHVLIIKELLAVWRDPKSRFILIIPPLIQMLVFSFAATHEVRNVTLGVLDEDHTAVTADIVSRFAGAPTFTKIIHLAHQRDIQPVIDDQKVLAVLHFGPEFTRNLERDNTAPLQMILDGRKSNAAQIVQSYASVILRRFNEDWAKDHNLAQPPAALVIRFWFNPNLINFWSIVPALAGILTMVVGLVVTALSVARERELGTFEQLLVTPLKPWEILIGKTVPGLLIGLAEGSVIIAIAIFGFHIPFTGSLWLLYLSLAVFLLSVIGVGLFISSLVKTQQQAILGTFLFMVPSVILSGFATPVENMPHWLELGTRVNPLRFFIVIVHGVFIKDMPADTVLNNLLPMTIVGVITMAASAWFFRRRLY